MQLTFLSALEWPLLLEQLTQFAQTPEGLERLQSLKPGLSRQEILSHWNELEPLANLASQGYHPAIGDVQPVAGILKSARLGQLLDGSELKEILYLLESVKKVYAFARDFSPKCSTLERIRNQIYPLPILVGAIDKAIDHEGKLKDTASAELTRIRKEKRSLAKRIEEKLRTVMTKDETLSSYLQEDFFTLRSERYVIPIRIDGRGRVPGAILDTSASGQTLFVEPRDIAPLNDGLQELEADEKIEIIRIFTELTSHVKKESETISQNYESLIRLDELTAQARYADQIRGVCVELTDTPGLSLIKARHPLIHTSKVVANDIDLATEQKLLVISGPNAGGKTVILKTVGLLHAMVSAGLMIPVDRDSTMYLFRNIFLEMGDAQNLSANLSTFSGHITGIKPILEQCGSEDLVLMDELAVGTEPHTGAAIAQAVLEHLAERKSIVIVTTHYDNLKSLALSHSYFRNGSMEFSIAGYKPTYRLILDIPGQSYGLEVARQIGLKESIVERARLLKGERATSLDQAVENLSKARQELEARSKELKELAALAANEKAHWEQEVKLLKASKEKQVSKLVDSYEGELSSLRDEIRGTLTELKKSESVSDHKLHQERERLNQKFSKLNASVRGLQNTHSSEALPGVAATFETLKLGDKVFVMNLRKEARVIGLGNSQNDKLEIEVGNLKIRVDLSVIRKL